MSEPVKAHFVLPTVLEGLELHLDTETHYKTAMAITEKGMTPIELRNEDGIEFGTLRLVDDGDPLWSCQLGGDDLKRVFRRFERFAARKSVESLTRDMEPPQGHGQG